jgi:hypothetical protein
LGFIIPHSAAHAIQLFSRQFKVADFLLLSIHAQAPAELGGTIPSPTEVLSMSRGSFCAVTHTGWARNRFIALLTLFDLLLREISLHIHASVWTSKDNKIIHPASLGLDRQYDL